jgi:alpha-ketoglutarate-dependent taurine dioxygenase
MQTTLKTRDLTPSFGSEVIGLEPSTPLDDSTCAQLRQLFDDRGLLVFRDLDIDHHQQLWISKMLIRQEHVPEKPGTAQVDDNFYVSNRRDGAAAPFGRLQFHADTMWADKPFEVLSLYGKLIEPPAIPTLFVSGVSAWQSLPARLRERVAGLSALHTAGEVRRGDLTNVLVSTVQRPPTSTQPIAKLHPRTGATVLYVCEQMTKEIVGLTHTESEALLEALFEHMYDPAAQFQHEWRQNDFVVWDNVAIQHARPNVNSDGPARTLRKAASPIPQLDRDQLPSFSSAT